MLRRKELGRKTPERKMIMHMADALVSPAVGATMAVAAAAAAGYSIYKVKQEDDPKKIPEMGIMGAFVFATQMINFTIPGTGSSGHLCGGILLTALLGPYAGFLTMIGVLSVQCLFFADGGLLALGCNIWNMAFYGCFIGALIWRFATKKGVTKGRITAAAMIGCVLTLQFGAFSVTLETLASGITALPFTTFLAVMLPIHLAIGFVEGLITTAVLCFIEDARPELLWCPEGNPALTSPGKLSRKKTFGVLAALCVVIAGGVSLLASANPDGLEWSMARLTGSTELEAAQNSVSATAESIQSATAFLPDYAFKQSDSVLGTSVSGIVGGLIVVGVLLLACYAFRFFRHKRADH